MLRRASRLSWECTSGACFCALLCFFFFSSRRRHTRFDCDWSSDVCSSDLKRVLRAQRFSSLTSPVTEVFGGMMIVGILWYGTLLALGDRPAMRPEELITFLVVALRLMSPVKSVSNYPAVMAGALASAGRVYEVLDLTPDEGDRPGETTAQFHERIEYRRVSFAYADEAEVLRDVELEVRRGQVVAVVGPSGGGENPPVGLRPPFSAPPAAAPFLDRRPLTPDARRSR